MKPKQISILLENSSVRLYATTHILQNSGIEISWI